MYSEEAIILDEVGLHARPASDFTNLAKKFTSKIELENLDSPEDGSVNAKSIIHVLSLSVTQGQKVKITASGEDEVAAVTALVNVLGNKGK